MSLEELRSIPCALIKQCKYIYSLCLQYHISFKCAFIAIYYNLVFPLLSITDAQFDKWQEYTTSHYCDVLWNCDNPFYPSKIFSISLKEDDGHYFKLTNASRSISSVSLFTVTRERSNSIRAICICITGFIWKCAFVYVCHGNECIKLSPKLKHTIQFVY